MLRRDVQAPRPFFPLNISVVPATPVAEVRQQLSLSPQAGRGA